MSETSRDTPSLDQGFAEIDKMMRSDAGQHRGLAEIDRMMSGRNSSNSGSGPKRETKRERRKRQRELRCER